MGSLNKVQIIGNLGADPEMRFTASGQAVATFNVAVNRRYQTRDGERREETEWVRCVAWARLASRARFGAKSRPWTRGCLSPTSRR